MKRLEIDCAKALVILNKVHFFDNFSRAEKDILTGFHSHFLHVAISESIISEGASDNSFYVLLSGKVAVHKQGAIRPLAALHPGDCFGEVSFLTERRRSTTIKALSDCIVFEIDYPTLKHMDIKVREKLKDNLIHILVKRLDHMNELVTKMSLRIA